MKWFFSLCLLLLIEDYGWCHSPKVFIITYRQTKDSQQAAERVYHILKDRFNIPELLIEQIIVTGPCQKKSPQIPHSILEICLDETGQEYFLHLDRAAYQRSFRQLQSL